MATPEGRVKAKVKRILDNREVKHWSPFTGGYGRSGVHDIHALYRGHFISIEVKATEKDKPTALQIREAVKMIGSGASVLLIHKDNTDNLEKTLDLIDNHLKITSSPLLQTVFWPDNQLTYE